MSLKEEDLTGTEELLKNPILSKEQVRAYSRALAWVRENRDALGNAGWTVDELFRMGAMAYPYSEWGPAWLTLWNNDKCEPRLSGRGHIEFVLHEPGGDVVQTCRVRKNYLS